MAIPVRKHIPAETVQEQYSEITKSQSDFLLMQEPQARKVTDMFTSRYLRRNFGASSRTPMKF